MGVKKGFVVREGEEWGGFNTQCLWRGRGIFILCFVEMM